jgi:hypothetical protein
MQILQEIPRRNSAFSGQSQNGDAVYRGMDGAKSVRHGVDPVTWMIELSGATITIQLYTVKKSFGTISLKVKKWDSKKSKRL